MEAEDHRNTFDQKPSSRIKLSVSLCLVAQKGPLCPASRSQRIYLQSLYEKDRRLLS